MAHPALTGSAAGSWFHRLGLAEAFWLDNISLYGAAATTNVLLASQVPVRLAAWEVDLAAGNADYQVATLVQQFAASLQGTPSNVGSQLQGAIQQLFINMTNLDSPLPILTVTAALNWLVTCMTADAATINFGTLPAAGAQTNGIAAVPVGNPVFLVSVKDSAGRGLQYLFPETLTLTITQDAQNGGTAGQEAYSIVGQNANPNPFSYDWLLSGRYGSGATLTGNLVDPSISFATGGGTNLTVNGTFTAYTGANANYPDNWVIAVGAAGSTVLTGAGTSYYTGQGSVLMVSDGATAISLTQSFNTTVSTTNGAGGTPYVLLASAVNNTQYAVFVAYKLSVASPAAGVLTVDLIDGSGTVVADDAGVNNTFNVALTGVADTLWHTLSGVFRLPQALPASTPYKVRVRQSTAVTTGKSVYIGAVGAAVMPQLYAGGPFCIGFRGSINPNSSGIYDDTWTIALTATIGKLQKAMWRWINPSSLSAQNPGFIVPAVTSGSATVSDALVT